MRRSTTRQFTAVFRRQGRWIAAFVEEIPGVNTQGRTMASARANLRDALWMILKAHAAISRRQRRRLASRERFTHHSDWSGRHAAL
jgi:predicted RNase H-like HicB family nuclease